MTRLPCIVGFGGANAAGRSSFHHAYNRMILEALEPAERQRTMECLAAMMNLVTESDEGLIDREGNHVEESEIEELFGEKILNGTMIRRVESNHFDVDAAHWQQKVPAMPNEGGVISFVTTKRNVPDPLPNGWNVSQLDEKRVRVDVSDQTEFKVNAYRDFPVKSAGQLPTGFDPGAFHNARFQPRGTQLGIFSSSDALHSLGIPWETVEAHVGPEEIGVYGGSAFPPFQEEGFGGMLQSRLKGDRVSTKALAMGINSMPADFVNAYVIGCLGQSGSYVAACATFLYNLRVAVADIQAGKIRAALVMNTEAPITQEIMDGFATMGALATEENVRKLDGSEEVDPRTVSRPFGQNCGFTIGESGQVFILMDDELALELGAEIYGSVSDVFTAADGYKKSISGPGAGNYLTMARAVSAARNLVGDDGINRSIVLAHGSSTPQNRVTESHIFHTVAETFNIENWPVGAVKSCLGHTIGAASADQLSVALGVFAKGILPGVTTTEKVADDVYDEHLTISSEHQDLGVGETDVAFLNSKGFGGTNATAAILSPNITESMLEKRHGKEALGAWKAKREGVRETAKSYDDEAIRGNYNSIYRFGENMIDEAKIEFTQDKITIPGYENPVSLDIPNLYKDMT